jgi:hypothetical protein
VVTSLLQVRSLVQNVLVGIGQELDIVHVRLVQQARETIVKTQAASLVIKARIV